MQAYTLLIAALTASFKLLENPPPRDMLHYNTEVSHELCIYVRVTNQLMHCFTLCARDIMAKQKFEKLM